MAEIPLPNSGPERLNETEPKPVNSKELHSLYRDLKTTYNQNPQEISQKLERIGNIFNQPVDFKLFDSTSVALQSLTLHAENPLVRHYCLELIKNGALQTTSQTRYGFTTTLGQLTTRNISEQIPFRQKLAILQARKVFDEVLNRNRETALEGLDKVLYSKRRASGGEGHIWIAGLVSQEKSRLIKEAIETESGSVFRHNLNLVSLALVCQRSPGFEKEGIDAIKEVIAHFGLDPEKTFTDWTESYRAAWRNEYNYSRNKQLYRSADFVPDMIENLVRIRCLSQEHPEAPKLLQQTFNISDFGRYSFDLLEEQFKNIADFHQKYCLIVYPKFDWNGAFYESAFALDNLKNQLKKIGVLTRVTEAKNIVQIYDMLAKDNEQYNQSGKNKVAALVIGGHGNPANIEFGSGGPHGINNLSRDIFDETEKSSLPDYHLERVRRCLLEAKKKFLAPKAPVVLISCDTGKPKAIGQKVSAKLATIVSAPTTETHIRDFKVYKDRKGKLGIYPIYQEGSTATFVSGQTRDSIS